MTHRTRRSFRCASTALTLAVAGLAALPAPILAQQDVIGEADDAFGSRIGQESIGLYSESLVRGFNLQQAGNYRIDGAYFVRAAPPPDTIVDGARILVGPAALPVDFPAPSGIVQYRLPDVTQERARLELGFQHLLDSNPRPYLRGHFSRRSEDGRASLSGGVLGSPSARYIFGNEARYHSLGLVPRFEIGDDWQATVFYGVYDQAYQADAGFQPAGAHALPQPDRLRYPGQPWSRFDTRNTTYGALLRSRARPDAWNFSFSDIHSRVDRPRSDYNLFRDVTAGGDASASTVVARDREVFARAYEAAARRDWSGETRRDVLTLAARARRSDYRNPRVQTIDLGRVSLFEPIPHAPPPDDPGGAHSHAGIDQDELALGWQHLRRSGLAVNLGLRRVRLDESSWSADGAAASRTSAQWLHNASLVLPLSPTLTAFASTTRGIEEAGTAPQNAANRFEVLPPAMARQSELGIKWQAAAGLAVVATAFEIGKPEPGLDADGVYRFLTDVRHRGVELSAAGQVTERLHVVAGVSWLRPRLEGALVEAGVIGERPVGRSSTLALASFSYRPPAWERVSFDADATWYGRAPADAHGHTYTSGYALLNVGARYRFALGRIPAQWRLRVYNAADRYAWSAGSSGLQSWEPARRVMLSLTLGE
ncbi:TonB-dependent siderophore receptor [Luteimonas suaedae]|uniref:TonB-dependent siderophore receptor n=1 Tax=Luteimonas suaedae TaxID=2605430 RepID=UPI0011EE4CAE|nr:TonB-dependent receptor [Luteimonas suaedae]